MRRSSKQQPLHKANDDFPGVPQILPNDSRGPATRSNSDDEKDFGVNGKPRIHKTHEERLKEYNQTRERIWAAQDAAKTQNDNEAGPNDTGIGISRSSSSSGVKKRRQKKPKDDSFEARSAYSQFGGHAILQSSQTQSTYSTPYQNSFSNYTPFSGAAPSFQSSYSPMTPSTSRQGFVAANNWNENQDPNYFNPSTTNQAQFSSMNYNGSNMQSFGSPNYASQVTPKAHNPALATYNQAYQPQPLQDQTNWNQMAYQYGYAPSMFYPVASMSPSSAPNASQMMYTMPYGTPAGYMQADVSNYNTGTSSNYGNIPQFNPQSQAFVPQVQMSAASPNGQNGNVSGWYPSNQNGSPSIQRQRSSNSYVSSVNGQHYTSSPTRPTGPSPGSHSQHQRSYGRPSSQQQSSIAKFGNSANLPAKPPPPSSALSFQVPKQSATSQPLPSNPYSNNNNNIQSSVKSSGKSNGTQ